MSSSLCAAILLRSVTVVGVVCLLGIGHAHGASLVTMLHNRARMKRQSNDDTASKGGDCTLDYGIHLQLTEIEADIQSVFVNYIFEAPGIPLLDSSACFPSIESSPGYNGQWIAARVEQIRQFTPWYQEIELHAWSEDSVLQARFYPRFLSLINLVNSTIDRLERRMVSLSNNSRCTCPETVLDASQVLTENCFILPPPEIILPDTFRRDVSGVVRLLHQILHDLNSRRVERPIC